MLTLLPVRLPPTRLVRMRLAVVLTPEGGWGAVGWSGAVPSEAAQMANTLADMAGRVVVQRDVEVELPAVARIRKGAVFT